MMSFARFALLLGAWTAAGASYRVNEVPNPNSDFVACGLDAPGRVCDPDRLLSDDSRARVQQTAALVSSECKHECGDGGAMKGYQLAVVVIEKMDPGFYRREEDNVKRAKSFSAELAESWGVGNRACDDGIILFVSQKDRALYLHTARGSKKALPNRYTDYIVRAVTSELKKTRGKDLDAGVEGGAALVLDMLQGGESVQKAENLAEKKRQDAEFGLYLFGACIVGFICLMNYPYVEFALVALFYVVAWPFAWAMDKIQEWRRGGADGPAAVADDDAQAMAEIRRIQREANREPHQEPGLCTICLEDLPCRGAARTKPTTTLQCGHRFHTECLAEWVAQNPSCPLCRAEIPRDWKTRQGDAKSAKPIKTVDRLARLLERVQERHPRWGRGRGGAEWRPRDAATRLYSRRAWDDWDLYFSAYRYRAYNDAYMRPRYTSWTSQLPNLTESLHTARRRAAVLAAQMAESRAANDGSDSDSGWGGGGGFSSGGGGSGGSF